MQASNKRTTDVDGKHVHVHLTMGNLAGCFFNFGAADTSSFPFPGRAET